MNIVDFIDSLSDEIFNPEIQSKKNALNKLSDFLSSLPITTTNSDSVNCLVDFYINILNIHYDLIPTILNGLLTIIDFYNFSDDNARAIICSLVQLEVPQLQSKIRQKIFELFYQLFTFNLKALKTLDDNFISQFITVIDGENDPECVLLVMKLNYIIVTNLEIDIVCDEYFEAISTYFPIEFKANKNTSSTLTRDMLAEIMKKCMLGSPLFGSKLLPQLLEKISSDRKFARIDSLDILVDGFELLKFSDVMNYHMSFVDCLFYEFRNRDHDNSKLALRALESLARVFEKKSTEKELLEFCWHLYEVLQSIVVDNDTSVLPFMHAAIDGGDGRIWSALLAYFIPAIVDQFSNEDTQNCDKLAILNELLASGAGNWARYPGLINSDKTRVLFEKLQSEFDRAICIESGCTDEIRLTIIFSLLGYSLLFETSSSQSGDTEYMVQSRCKLVRSSISWILVNPDSERLKEAGLVLVPLLWRASTTLAETPKNAFTDMIIDYCCDINDLSELCHKFLSTVPIECLPVVVDFLAVELRDERRLRLATQCLSSLTTALQHENTCINQLCCLLKDALPDLIASQNALSRDSVDHVSAVLSHCAISIDTTVASDMLDQLLSAVQIHGPLEPCNAWLCAALSHWSLTSIELSMGAADLLNLLFAMLGVVRDPSDTRTAMCQAYSSLVNKLADAGSAAHVRPELEHHLAQLVTDIEFLLWNMKAALLASDHDWVGVLVSALCRPDNLCRALIGGIGILRWPPAPGSMYWVDESKLFPKRSVLYEQQSFHLVARPLKEVADMDGAPGSDVAMETYLKLIASYPTQLIDLSIEEIVDTVTRWFSKLATVPDKMSVRLEALRAICNLPTSDQRLARHSDEIAQSVAEISGSLSRLDAHDRLFLAKVIGWYATSFPDYDAVRYRPLFARCLRSLIADKKRVVRIQAARSNMDLL